MKRTLAFLCLLFLAGAVPAGAVEPPRYVIKADVDGRAKTIQAVEEVTFTNPSGSELTELYFHIYPNRRYTAKEKAFMLRYGGYFKVNPFPAGFPDAKFTVNSVSAGAETLAHAIEGEDGTLLKVALSRPLAPGASLTLAIDFFAEIPQMYGRYGWIDNIIKLSRWYPILAVHDGEKWNTAPFYPYHRPFYSDAAYYDVALTVEKDQVVIHSGELRSEEAAGERTVKHLTTPQPVREFTLALSPDYRVKDDEFDGVKVRSFYLPGDEKAADAAIASAKSLMAFYTELFGAYPYSQFSIAPVPLGNGGEQMANMIFLDTRVYKLPGFLARYFDFLVAHETGHQWLFNVVGMNEYTEMWLEEGINSYFIQEYLEKKYGTDAAILEYPEWFKGYEWALPELTFRRARDIRYKTVSRIGYDRAIVSELSSFNEPSSIFSLTYGKGAGVVNMLRHTIGDDAFARVFRRVFEEYRFKNLTIKEFIRLCQEESHQDLAAFFDQWLYAGKQLDYAVGPAKGQSFTIERRGTAVSPVEVLVAFADGTEKTYQADGQNAKEIVMTDNASPIRHLRLDPREELLDVDRTNDQWPRKLHIKPVPLYLGLYDIPIFMPEDSYNLIVGPELANNGFGVKAALHKPFDYTMYGGTDYEFGEELHHSRAGYQLNNIFHTQTALGVEVANRHDLDDGSDDLASGKVFLRRELWPAPYNVTELNDHVSLYLLRNRSINDGAAAISGREDGRNTDYSRRNESIVGTSFSFNRSGPSPDPLQGYKLNTFFESAGHFLGASQYFNRSAVDLAVYRAVTPKSKTAARIKYGWGSPDDKVLYYMGGMDGLRGYDRKDLRGANMLLGSLEYRFPLVQDINRSILDNILGLEGIDGVVFFDMGQSWFGEFENSSLKKDAGFGLRFKVNVGSMLEKVVVRADVALPINEHEEDTHFWLGINHAF